MEVVDASPLEPGYVIIALIQGFGSAFFFADPDPGKNFHADPAPDPNPGGIRGRGVVVKGKLIFF